MITMETEIVGLVPLQDGVYQVVWGGYEVDTKQPTFDFDEEFNSIPAGTLKLRSKDGIRTPRAEAILTVKDMHGTVRTKR